MTVKEAITELVDILKEHRLISKFDFDEDYVLKALDREGKEAQNGE